MQILDNVKKVPGGLLLVPMAITAIINTIFPGALRIGGPLSGICSPLGTQSFIGMMLLVAGSQVKASQLGGTFARGGVLVIARIIIGFITAWLCLKFLGLDGIFGASTLTLVIIMASCNPGIYMGLMNDFGDNVDKAAVGIITLIGTPQVSLLILSVVSGGGINVLLVILSILVPFLIGVLLGNLDEKIRGFFATGTPISLVFIGACLGSAINLYAFKAIGLANIFILALVVFVSIPLMLLVDKLILRRPGYASVAFSTIGGISVAAPSLVGSLLPQYKPYVDIATAQCALTVILASIVVPYICKWVVKKFGSGKEAAPAPAAAK